MFKEENLKKFFASAFQNHQNKKFNIAEKLYKKVLKDNPEHFESIYLLGSLSVQTNNFILAKNSLKFAKRGGGGYAFL